MKPREFLRRINAIKRTQKITKAMEIVSSTQLRNIESRLHNIQVYFEEFDNIVKDIYLSYSSQPNPWFRSNFSGKVLIVVIGSDKGLCGAFNINLLNVLKKTLADFQREGKTELVIIPFGKKYSAYCRRYFGEEGLINYAGREMEISKIAVQKLISSYREEKVEKVILISTRYRKAGEDKFNKEVILPLSFEKEKFRPPDYILEPEFSSLLNKIVPRYLEAKIYQRLMESRAAEELSRMLAMKYASDNAEDMIKDFTLKYNRARQAQITRELLEITQAREEF